MDRTVKIQLHPTPEQAIALQETLRQFTEAFNAVCAYGWQHAEKNGVRLHHATYRETKTACPGLVSDLLIQARVKATEALRSALTWKAKHTFITYKAQERGITVVKIDPRHTSQTCSQCGYQHRANRRSQSLFLCRSCGYRLNADLNASYNIREKYRTSLASLGISLASGLPSSSLSSQSLD
jgi:predicted transposase